MSSYRPLKCGKCRENPPTYLVVPKCISGLCEKCNTCFHCGEPTSWDYRKCYYCHDKKVSF